MVVVSILPHAELGRNDHRKGAPHFTVIERKTLKMARNIFYSQAVQFHQ